jgi:hypothetical protein
LPAGPAIFVGNHVSYLDIPLLLHCYPEISFVSKKEVPDFISFAQSHPVIKLNFFRQLLLASKIKINFTDIPKKPMKIISSKQDRLVNPSCSTELVKKFGGVEYIHRMAL